MEIFLVYSSIEQPAYLQIIKMNIMISDQTLDSFLFTADAATTNSSFK